MESRRQLGALVLLLLFSTLASARQPISIGVLSHRGDEATLYHWSGTADYLSEVLPDYQFSIMPLAFEQVDVAVEQGMVDFILVNPAIYVNLEVRHRVSRIATMRNRVGDVAYNIFGGVLFARAERYDLNSLEDLKGGTLLAVDESSLGGYMMVLREFKAAGIEPYRELQEISFAGTHDPVVMAVREGRVDAGIVRSDILERMAAEGQIHLNEFRIINQQSGDGFPLLHSTRLYPEWPFSKVRHTPNRLARAVSVALAEMPEEHPAALRGNYAGWTIPLDYQPVHDLLQELLLPPYQYSRQFTLLDVWQRYWAWLFGGLVLLLIMGGLTTWVLRLNRELSHAKQRLEQQHALILDSVADGIYGVDTQGNSTFVNPAMERITGWSAEELIGKNQHQLLHHTRADGSPFPMAECPVYHTFRDDQSRYVDDDIFWCKDGRGIPVEYSSNPIRDENDRISGAVVVFRDITARKMAAEEARQHQIELAHIARLSTMGEMASGIAHELNQPLSAISNYTHGSIRMLKSGREGIREELIEVMERVASQAERAGEIIRQLRRFIRKEEPERSWVDINQLIRELVGFLQPELRKAGISLKLELDEGLPPLWAHDIQLEQVLLNLTRNAIEAMQDVPASHRHLLIRSSQFDGQLLLLVEDSGHGIDEALRESIFEPFVTTKAQGMGLGLSISRGIIEAHGGRLVLEKPAAKGTRIRISLPFGKEEQGD
ncbi:MAG: PhnD/SsuA/transferrin family substrate-binding protein [Gammaproteobacteria bacterium]|nr:PhnD/SsuA/transferrin family substrate-binding protein [Gammaproteobacteria bacterium]